MSDQPDNDSEAKPRKKGLIRRAAGGLTYSFIGRLPEQLSEQRGRLAGLVGDIINRQRTATNLSDFTEPELRNIHKVSMVDGAVMGALLAALLLGAWLKFPDMRSLLVLFGLALFVLARLHRDWVNWSIIDEETSEEIMRLDGGSKRKQGQGLTGGNPPCRTHTTGQTFP